MKKTKKTIAFFSLLLGSVFILSACAPALLGDRELSGKIPDFFPGSKSFETVAIVSDGDRLSVEIHLPSGDVCKGDFTLHEINKRYLFIGKKELVYLGKWNSGLSKECNELLSEPGDREREIIFTDTDITGHRSMTICNEGTSFTCFFDLKIYRVEG